MRTTPPFPPLLGEGLCPIERPVDGRRTNQGGFFGGDDIAPWTDENGITYIGLFQFLQKGL